MSNPLVSINLVVMNGERYLRHCLEAVKKQTYGNIEVTILDNNSSDRTREIIAREYPEFRLIKSAVNLGTWGGFERLVQETRGAYVVCLSVDVILDPDFVGQAVAILEGDPRIGGVEPKIYQYDIGELEALPAGRQEGKPLEKKVIDTCGFQIFRSRRVLNIGHGEKDRGQYAEQKEVFAVEGAAPIFRRAALEDNRIQGKFADPDFFWYADDLDLGWRMRLFGWKQIYSPYVIAWHNRSTTKTTRSNTIGSTLGFIRRRREIPFQKRALDYRNQIFTFIKNDYVHSLLLDLPYIFMRHVPLWGYFLIFEPKMLWQLVIIFKMLPNMLKKRKAVMRKATVSHTEIHRWFLNG